MGWYFQDGGSRYGPALEITSKRDADEFFARLVDDNMQAAGPVRKRKEAEAIERRNLAHFVANMDEDVKARIAKLCNVARLPKDMIRKATDPAQAPSRPAPHVLPVSGKALPGFTDDELEVLIRGGFKVSAEGRQSGKKPGVDPRRRDSWKPWSLQAGPPPGDWKPWGWIEV